MALETYLHKRNFLVTPEPKENGTSQGSGLSFVVQEHHASHLHYDFRLEMDGVLKSWAVPKGPPVHVGEKRLAVAVEDHPLSYGTFSGTIPEGNYGAGTVAIWDSGTYTLTSVNSAKGSFKFQLNGTRLQGLYSLSPMKGDKNWLLIKVADTKHTEDAFPEPIKPMLATLIDAPFDNSDWVFEVKWDGYRCVTYAHQSEAKLYSRSGRLFNEKYPEIAAALSKMNINAVLDGEIVALDENGQPNFQLLQNTGNQPANLVYYIFDILWLNGTDLRQQPLLERKRVLTNLIPNHPTLKISEAFPANGTSFFQAAEENHLEGIIAKRAISTYQTGARSDDWLKIKTSNRQEVIIAGFTEPRGSRTYFGALILAVKEHGRLRYVGHAGTGFNAMSLKILYDRMLPLATSTSPFETAPPTNAPVTWVKPELVCEVEFQNWTEEGFMRHPTFKGLREDKTAHEVVKEEKKHMGTFAVTHPDKLYWPEENITKGDLLHYYETVAPVMLPYLIDRPHTLNRHPNGIEGAHFFQKEAGENLPDYIKTVQVHSESNGRDIDYVVCTNTESLLYMANNGCIEINPWNSRIQHLESPDYLLFDLDPGDISFNEVIGSAREIKDILNHLKAPSFCKTSGKSGLHIYVPLGAQYKFETVRYFAEMLSRILTHHCPSTTIERSLAKRGNKIYIDFMQNRFGQTTAAAYSVRPHPGATVSTPLSWDEVKSGLNPADFTIHTIPQRIQEKGDLWSGVLGPGINIKKALEKIDKL